MTLTRCVYGADSAQIFRGAEDLRMLARSVADVARVCGGGVQVVTVLWLVLASGDVVTAVDRAGVEIFARLGIRYAFAFIAELRITGVDRA